MIKNIFLFIFLFSNWIHFNIATMIEVGRRSHNNNDMFRIKDAMPQHLMIDKGGNILDFTCLFRAFVYAEIHLKKIYQALQNNQTDIEDIRGMIEKEMPKNIKTTNFLGLSFGNYVSARIFQNLCINAYENGCHINGLCNSDNNYEIYNKICFLPILSLNGPIVGFGASLVRKKGALKAVQGENHGKWEKYFAPIYEEMNQKYDVAKKILDKDTLNKYPWIITDEIDAILDHINILHQNKSYFFTVVTSSDCSGKSATLHATAITIISTDGKINFFVSEGANNASIAKELETIKELINNYNTLKNLREKYKILEKNQNATLVFFSIKNTFISFCSGSLLTILLLIIGKKAKEAGIIPTSLFSKYNFNLSNTNTN